MQAWNVEAAESWRKHPKKPNQPKWLAEIGNLHVAAIWQPISENINQVNRENIVAYHLKMAENVVENVAVGWCEDNQAIGEE